MLNGPSKVMTSWLVFGNAVKAVTTGPLPSAKESTNRASKSSMSGRKERREARRSSPAVRLNEKNIAYLRSVLAFFNAQ